MKMKKVIVYLTLTATLLFLLCPFINASDNPAIDAADSLYSLGLFQGTGKDADGNPIYDLERAPRRDEAITMLVRIIGKEKEALEGNWELPFTDVADWAKPYIGYAYTNGITNGTSATTFGSSNTVTAAQYITLVLRALGYNDANGDFVWSAPWPVSNEIGLTQENYSDTNNYLFTRGDIAIVSRSALDCELADHSSKLIDLVNKPETPSTEIPAVPEGQKIYVTPTGKRYHYDSSCNGGTYIESTLEEALKRNLTPCNKCVLE